MQAHRRQPPGIQRPRPRWLPAVITACVAVSAQAGDWPQYRGPNHDGRSTEVIRTNWAENPPTVLWKVPLDPALSSLAIGGGRVFTQARRRVNGEDREFCIALDADTGQELWARDVGLAFYPNGGVGPDDGPRSTPTIDGERVYVLSSYLDLHCFDAASGAVVWSQDLRAEFGGNVIPWQNAASPLLVGDLIFLNCNASPNRLLALRKTDGSVAWRRHNHAMTQSTPVAATIAGALQIVFFTQTGLVSVDPGSGDQLWVYPFAYSTSTAASPVVAGDMVYCSAAYGSGAGVVRIGRSGTGFVAEEVWRTPGANMNHWATPVYHEGFLYGIFGQSLLRLECLDARTGQRRWDQSGVGYGSVLLVSHHLLVFTAGGDLVLVKPDPTAYVEVARFKAVNGKCWNNAAISNGRIYARSTTEAAAIDVAPPSPPPPKLELRPSLAATEGAFKLVIGPQDGSALDAARAARIEIFTTTDVASDAAQWQKLEAARTLIDGRLEIEDPTAGTTPRRFFRTVEPE